MKTFQVVIALVWGSLAASLMVLLIAPKEPPTRFVTCKSSDTLDGLSWPIDLTQDLVKQRCEIDPQDSKQLLCKHPDLEVVCKLP